MTLTSQSFFHRTEAELRFIMRDASEAAALVRNFDAQAEAKYMEQFHDAGSVLASRERRAA